MLSIIIYVVLALFFSNNLCYKCTSDYLILFFSHLMGTFYRTIRLIENGIKPVFVFDGKPPQLKSGELEKRAERREEAQKELDKATEAGKQLYNDITSMLRVSLLHLDFFFQVMQL